MRIDCYLNAAELCSASDPHRWQGVTGDGVRDLLPRAVANAINRDLSQYGLLVSDGEHTRSVCGYSFAGRDYLARTALSAGLDPSSEWFTRAIECLESFQAQFPRAVQSHSLAARGKEQFTVGTAQFIDRFHLRLEVGGKLGFYYLNCDDHEPNLLRRKQALVGALAEAHGMAYENAFLLDLRGSQVLSAIPINAADERQISRDVDRMRIYQLILAS